ncbi:MAG TPA: membrane protein insertase YidC [Thermoanaerobaculaceae bacterium]|nr:membrane protein insertase YidC [Thermoanaerobaculaceae bacterium]HRS17793.1 membrane protein insertase YidC [Thermoanaerobaculaceae bacterium]
MERRVLLAAILSGIVIIVWFALFTPPPARPPEAPHAAEAAPTPSPAATSVPPERAGDAPVPLASREVREAVVGAEASDVIVEGNGVTAVLSPRGGVIRSLVVSGYAGSNGGPLELVRPGPELPLWLAAPGPWNEELYAVERLGNGVVLRWSDGKGSWVDKHLEAGAGRFSFQVRVEAGGEAARGGVRVAAGLAEEGKEGGSFAVSDAVVRAQGDLEHVNPNKVKEGWRTQGAVDFAGVEDRYFLLVMLPDPGMTAVEVKGLGPGIADVFVRGEAGKLSGTLYAGPKDHTVLEAYGRGLSDTISFGIFGFLSVGFLAALRWIHGWVGNWGVSIIVLTAGIRLLLFPLNHKATVSMQRMQKLQPKMKAIQERYQERAKKDPQVRARMNQEIMGLYKAEGINPMGGCLPNLAQLPILYALYTLFAYAIELRHAPFVLWIKDLSIKDPTYITPILMTATWFLQQKLSPPVGDPAQRRLFMLMPIVFGFMFMNFPAGLVLYWFVNNLLTIGQQVVTQRLLARSEAKA